MEYSVSKVGSGFSQVKPLSYGLSNQSVTSASFAESMLSCILVKLHPSTLWYLISPNEKVSSSFIRLVSFIFVLLSYYTAERMNMSRKIPILWEIVTVFRHVFVIM